MFTPLHSSMNQELFEKYACNQSSHYENTMVMRIPVIVWNRSIHCSSVNLLHSSTNQELFEKNLCNQGNHYEK